MRVLLVHGYPAETSRRATALESAGYVVDEVRNADEAFEDLELYDYDIAVLDKLPAENDACKIIRRMRARQIETPVLMLTAWASNGLVVAALRAGADDVLTHSISDEELVARIEAIVRRRGGHAQSTLRVGSMAIDMSAHTVVVAGQSMCLSNKEFGLLQLLALRRGVVVTRENVLSSLYNGRDDPQSRTIEVFVCNLRKKMVQIGADVTIDTVHGVGYILRVGVAGDIAPILRRTLHSSAPVVGRELLAAA